MPVMDGFEAAPKLKRWREHVHLTHHFYQFNRKMIETLARCLEVWVGDDCL